jgi:hypothetical protein
MMSQNSSNVLSIQINITTRLVVIHTSPYWAAAAVQDL